jgi:hypothetical protein
MASSVATDKMACNLLVQVWDHDPNSTAVKVTSPDAGTTERWVDMRDYLQFAVIVAAAALTGSGVTLVEIVASDAEDETDGSVTVVKTSGVLAADALADWAFLECTAEEIAHLGAAAGYELRYVAARITCQNAADEALVVYLAVPKRPHDALTAASTIS